MFSCEFCEISKNKFFYRTPPVVASKRHFSILALNTFHVTGSFLYPLETSETSDMSMG